MPRTKAIFFGEGSATKRKSFMTVTPGRPDGLSADADVSADLAAGEFRRV